MSELDQARSVKDELVGRIGGHPAVAGVGVARAGDGGWAVKVNLTRAAPELRLPERLRDVAIVVAVVGPIKAR